jgi:hypothetical protein
MHLTEEEWNLQVHRTLCEQRTGGLIFQIVV